MLEARLNQVQVVKTYTGTAKVYDIWAALTESKARYRALAKAAVKDGESILEVAVGTGLMFRELVSRNPNGKTHGIDLTPAMLEKARHKISGLPAKDIKLTVGSAFTLDYLDNSFDLLVNNYMFDLMPEQDFLPLLQEFRRVLKPDGRLLLVNMAQAKSWYQGFWEKVYQFNPKWMGGCRGVTLRPYLQQAEFKQIEEQRVTQFGFPSEILLAVK